MAPKQPYRREILVTVIEEWDGHDHEWSAEARLPDGRLLALNLSDDMPYSPGTAIESAGRQLDANLAEKAWEALYR